MRPLTIAVDVDQVVADLHTEWFRLYNQDYGDNLNQERMLTWDIENFVKPECGIKILDYLRLPTLYDNVKPVDKALWGVNYLRDLGHRVVFASSCFIGTEAGKLKWLLDHEFLKLLPNANTCKDWMPISDKSLIYSDILIDDRPLYIQTFKGVGVIFDYPYNKGTLADARLKNWAQIPEIMSDLYSMFNESVYA